MSVHLDLMLARLLGVLLAEPLTSSDGQGIPIVWLVKWKPGQISSLRFMAFLTVRPNVIRGQPIGRE